MGDKIKKKKVTSENTRKSTDYSKKAAAVNAPSGTKLAPKGSEMRARQDAYAKEKIAAKGTPGKKDATSLNRQVREATMAESMKKADAAAASTFKNSAYKIMESKFK